MENLNDPNQLLTVSSTTDFATGLAMAMSNHPRELICDLDGVINSGSPLAHGRLQLNNDRLQMLRTALDESPQTAITVMTSRLLIYTWTNWLQQLEEALTVPYIQRPVVMPLTDDAAFDSIRSGNIPPRAIVVNAGKFKAEQLFMQRRLTKRMLAKKQPGPVHVSADRFPTALLGLIANTNGRTAILDSTMDMLPFIEGIPSLQHEIQYVSIERQSPAWYLKIKHALMAAVANYCV